MHVMVAQTLGAPDAFAFSALVIAGIVLVGGPLVAFVVLRKAKIAASQQEDLRQLVHRYEHLAENILDVQQRVAADMSDLRARTASVEQMIRSVE
jgi:hypothetical protein